MKVFLPERVRRKKRRTKVKEVVTVKGELKKKIVKKIKVDLDKCIGCRACEVACSAFHANPKYSSINPARSRIRMVIDELNDVYVPVRAGHYTKAECMGRDKYVIDGKEYNECDFCRASCSSRELFKEPDSGLPLKCDMCEDDPPQKEPLCVQVCRHDALTYEESEEEVGEEEVKLGEMEIGLESLVDKYGMQKVMDTVARMSKKG
jgi:benzoyl-CoA reductase subunit BamC